MYGVWGERCVCLGRHRCVEENRCMCVCVCTHVCVCRCPVQVYAHNCIYTWKPDVNFGCHSSGITHLIFLRQNLLLNCEFPILARLSGHQAPKIHLSLSPQCWDCRHVLPHLFLSWGAGDPNSDPQACSVRALPFTLAFCSCLSSEWFSLALSGVPSPGSGKGVNKQKSVGPSHRP